MKLRIEDKGFYKYIKLKEGRLDLFGASTLKARLFDLIQHKGSKNLVLDISQCFYCDASGLSTMMEIHLICQKAMGSFLITGIQTNINRLIKISMLDQVWSIVRDKDEAEVVLGELWGRKK